MRSAQRATCGADLPDRHRHRGDAWPLPAGGSLEQIDHSIAAWTKNLAANPHDYLSATNLATLYHGRGRLSADLARPGSERSRRSARRSRIVPATPARGPSRPRSATRSTTSSGGVRRIRRALPGDPTQLGALATRFDSELELGRIGDARADLATLAAATSGPAIDVRLARLAYVTGDRAIVPWPWPVPR